MAFSSLLPSSSFFCLKQSGSTIRDKRKRRKRGKGQRKRRAEKEKIEELIWIIK